VAGATSIVVVALPYLVSHNFNDGTVGPFVNGGGGDLDFPDDPTNSGSRGKVARFHYLRPTTDGSSHDVNRNIEYWHDQRYGQSMFFKGDFYIPVDDSGNGATQRKLLYFFPHVDNKYGGVGSRTFWTVITVQSNILVLDVTGMRQDNTNTGFAVPLGTVAGRRWYTLEIEQRMNSSISATDGIVRVWLDGVQVYENTAVTWTDPNWLGNPVVGTGLVLDPADVYFQRFDFGDQVNSTYAYDEYRYWDNVAFSSTRIGH
jgi:hypothetical protein